MKKYNINLKLLFAACILLLASCSQDDITKLPVSALSEDAFWTTEEQVIQATNQAYLTLPNVGNIEWDALTDVVFSQSGSINEVAGGSLSPGAGLVNSLWIQSYRNIRQSNWFFTNAEKVDLPASALGKYLGQWRFIRAWNHYQLLYQFGDVPLITDLLSITEGQVPASPRADVLSFVLNELDQAFTELSTSDYNPERGRITKWAVKALKARILLYEGTQGNNTTYLQQSAEAAKMIIDQGGFSLHPSYTELFRPEGEQSEEIILARVNADVQGQHHNLGQWLGPISFHASWNWITPTQALLDLYLDTEGKPIAESTLYNPNAPFENRDPRMKQSIFEFDRPVDYEGATFENIGVYYNFRKHINPAEQEEQRSHNDYIIFRLAELYLTYAEAMNELNGPSQEIVDLLNELRTRAGKGAGADGADLTMAQIALSDLTKEDLREIIRRERIVELVAEGILYFDYHRWQILETAMNKPAMGVSQLGDRSFQAPRDYLWPIPEFELINNPNLSQNSGW